MFDSDDSVPWYRSLTGLIAASVILPPVGLVLVWMQKNTRPIPKMLATAGIVILGVGYFYAFTAWRRSGANEAQYDLVEQTAPSRTLQLRILHKRHSLSPSNRRPRPLLHPDKPLHLEQRQMELLRHTPRKTTGQTFAGPIEMDAMTR